MGVPDMLASQFPAVVQMLLDAKADLTSFSDLFRAAKYLYKQYVGSSRPLS